MSKKVKFISLLIASVLSMSLFTSCVKSSKAESGEEFIPSISATPSDGATCALLSGDIYDVCANYEKLITNNYNKERIDMFAPTPLTVSWQSENQPLYYTVYLATKKDLSDAVPYLTVENSITFKYLYMGYDYYYQIEAKYEDKIIKSRIFEFSTEYLPRTIYVDDNVSNTRDWGGFYCEDGVHRVKQGIVYRGGKLEDITEAGKKVMLSDLKIKTDLDLRRDGTGSGSSPLGDTVTYLELQAPYYLGADGIDFRNTTDAKRLVYKQALIDEIKAFANPDNFPIYVHCSLGRDRTGTICFLINALLGVSEKDLYMDYELSMLSATGTMDNQTASHMVGVAFDGLYKYILNFAPQQSLSENAKAYMLSLGITEEEISAIKENMLEKV